MDILQLKYFQTVAKLEHMTRAAQQLNITQPALSKMISMLEKELGTPLFERKSKYIRLNDQGRFFLQYVNTALNALEDGISVLRDGSGDFTKTVNLYVEVASHLLPDLLASFRRQYPEIQFKLLQHTSAGTAPPAYDLSLSSSIRKTSSTDSITLLTEDILLAVPRAHHLASRSSVRLEELADEAFLSLSAGKTLRETTDLFCKHAGFLPKIMFESDDPATLRGLIKSGLGIAFIPAITWGGSTGSSVVLLPIENDFCKRSITLNWYSNRYLKKAAALFRDYTIAYFAKLTESAMLEPVELVDIQTIMPSSEQIK